MKNNNLKAILAVNNLGFIGLNYGLPWTCKEDFKHFKNQLNKGTILPEKLYYMLQEELDNGESKMTLLWHDIEDDLPNYQFIKFGSNSLMFPIVKK